jgi:hypothetical protein
MALSVDESDLKLNCSFDKMLLLVKCCSSLVNITFSKILEEEGNKILVYSQSLCVYRYSYRLVFISIFKIFRKNS